MWHLSQTKKTNLQLFVVSFYHYSGKHDYVLASWFSQLDWPSVFDGFAPILLYGVYSQLLHHPMYSIQFCPYHHCCWCHQGMIKDYVQHTVLPLPPPLVVPSTCIYMWVCAFMHGYTMWINYCMNDSYFNKFYEKISATFLLTRKLSLVFMNLFQKHSSYINNIFILQNLLVTYLGLFIGGDYVFSLTNFVGINIR